MSIFKNKLNSFSIELHDCKRVKEKLNKETLKLYGHTYRIKKIVDGTNICKYQMLPISLSSGQRNCFVPIIWIEITDTQGVSTAFVKLRLYTATSVILAVFCFGTILIETGMLIYLLYCIVFYHSTFTLETFKPFVFTPVIPFSMVIACCVTFQNIRKALLDEMKSV